MLVRNWMNPTVVRIDVDASMADIVRRYGGRLASILSSYDRAPEGFRHVYIRVYQVDREKIAQMVADLKAAAKLRYLVDHRENRREIFDA